MVSNLCDWISQFGCLLPRYIACTATNNDVQTQNIQNGSPDFDTPSGQRPEQHRSTAGGRDTRPKDSYTDGLPSTPNMQVAGASPADGTFPDVATGCNGSSGLVVNLPTRTIVNDLLCFVQNKIEQMPFDSPMQFCADFYSSDVIVAAKQLLYNTVPTKGRHVFRKGINKSRMNVSDIIKIFLEMEVCNAPVFVARNLLELPPLQMDSMDSLKVIQEIEAMQAQIKYVTSSQFELVKLVKSGAVWTHITVTQHSLKIKRWNLTQHHLLSGTQTTTYWKVTFVRMMSLLMNHYQQTITHNQTVCLLMTMNIPTRTTATYLV